MDRGVLAWSGGKDAAYALYDVRERDGTEVVELLTTIDDATDRSTMHGVRRSLYERQADALELPLNVVTLPPNPSNDAYERVMAREFERYRDRAVDRIFFADISLEDIRSYRENQLSDTGIDGQWPIWGRDTVTQVRNFLDAGFSATVVAVDGDRLDASDVGRELDDQFIDDLPSDVDPCGENGEFHTFVWDGPIFATPIPVEPTSTVTRMVGNSEFHYAELQLVSE